MKKHGKISKGILILIIVICVLAVLVASAVGVYFFDKQNKINQEKILDDVANSMYTSSNFDSETKTTGKFAIVENALKEYYTEYLNTSITGSLISYTRGFSVPDGLKIRPIVCIRRPVNLIGVVKNIAPRLGESNPSPIKDTVATNTL